MKDVNLVMLPTGATIKIAAILRECLCKSGPVDFP